MEGKGGEEKKEGRKDTCHRKEEEEKVRIVSEIAKK